MKDVSKAQKAFNYLMAQYPKTPNIDSIEIKKEILEKFDLTEKEIYLAYYKWKEIVLDIKEKPRFKNVKMPVKEIKEVKEHERLSFIKNIDKLKEIYERYKKGEDIEKLAEEFYTTKPALFNAFTRYRAKGVLNGTKNKKRNYVCVKGKKLTFKEVSKIIKRIADGENRNDIADELNVDRNYINNFYSRYKCELREEKDENEKRENKNNFNRIWRRRTSYPVSTRV